MPIHPENLTHPSVAKTSASTNTLPPWEPLRGLSELHREVIRKHVEGLPFSRIGYHLKRQGHRMSKTHMVRVTQSEAGRRYASLYSAQYYGGTHGLTDAMGPLLSGAVDVQAEIMYDPLAGERHRIAAAQDILDRGGLPKVSRQEGDSKTPTTVIINVLPNQMASFAAPPAMIEAEVVPLLDNPPSSTEE